MRKLLACGVALFVAAALGTANAAVASKATQPTAAQPAPANDVLKAGTTSEPMKMAKHHHKMHNHKMHKKMAWHSKMMHKKKHRPMKKHKMKM